MRGRIGNRRAAGDGGNGFFASLRMTACLAAPLLLRPPACRVRLLSAVSGGAARFAEQTIARQGDPAGFHIGIVLDLPAANCICGANAGPLTALRR